MLIIIALVMVVVLIYNTCAGSDVVQRIDKTLPDSTSAPFEIVTVTKTYMAQRAIFNDDKSVTMSSWYERDNKKWIFHEESITLPSLLHPVINRR